MFKAFWVIMVLKAVLIVGKAGLLAHDIREYRREMREQAALDAEKGLAGGQLVDVGTDGEDCVGTAEKFKEDEKGGLGDLKEVVL
jgi:hypothetical protein